MTQQDHQFSGAALCVPHRDPQERVGGLVWKTLGPEYVALIDRIELLDPEKDKLGAEIMFELTALNRLCTR
jgi:hypothetical protein